MLTSPTRPDPAPADTPSISRRLARSLGWLSVAWALSASALVWWVVRHEVDELMDHTLQESAEILYGVLRFDAHRLPLGQGAAMPAPPHHEQLVWQIVGAQGQVLLRSHHAPDDPLATASTRGLSSLGDAWRVFALPFDGAATLAVAQRNDERHEARLEAAALTVAPALAVGLLFAALMRRRAHHELQPLQALSNDVAHFDPLVPGATLAAANRQELQPLQAAVAGLGQRLARRLANERAFAAHAAHALRTPLAGLVTQLAVAQREVPDHVQPRLRQARDAADRLRRVVGALLTMFRTGADVRWQAIDLPELVSHLPMAHISTVASAQAPLSADPDLLAAALMNLLDNAQRLGASLVQMSSHRTPDGVCVSVHDDGPGLTPDKLAQLQRALDAQDYEGHMGMGLMLADLVARAHGGRLQLPRVPQGCRVELHLGLPPVSAPGDRAVSESGVRLMPQTPLRATGVPPASPGLQERRTD